MTIIQSIQLFAPALICASNKSKFHPTQLTTKIQINPNFIQHNLQQKFKGILQVNNCIYISLQAFDAHVITVFMHVFDIYARLVRHLPADTLVLNYYANTPVKTSSIIKNSTPTIPLLSRRFFIVLTNTLYEFMNTTSKG